jgi:hypothetical protein
MKHRALVFALAVGAATCGSKTPITPSPPPVVDPGPVVNNTPPVIGKFTIQGIRQNEPANFADALEEVPVSVEVTDAESSINDLKFNWTSSVGTFSGTGAKVTWKAPDKVDAPTVVTLNLEVVETYTSQGKPVTNNPKGSATLSLHDSVKEAGDMARQFLLDFSDSSIPVPFVMRNFDPTCYGTSEETAQVADNRTNFTIIASTIGPPNTSVKFGGICSFRSKPGDACARVLSYWKSRANKNIYNADGSLYAGQGQEVEAGPNIDQVAAKYDANQQRWKLCDSQFDPDSKTLRAQIRGLVP